MNVQSVPNMAKSSDVIIAGLRDKVGVLAERKAVIYCNAEKFYVSGKWYSRTCNIHAADRGKCAASLLCSKKNCVRLVGI